jgi:hypothetical protein
MRAGGFRASTAGGRGGGGGGGAAKVGLHADIVAARGRCAQVFCAQRVFADLRVGDDDRVRGVNRNAAEL